jgi:hypothetical protein
MRGKAGARDRKLACEPARLSFSIPDVPFGLPTICRDLLMPLDGRGHAHGQLPA